MAFPTKPFFKQPPMKRPWVVFHIDFSKDTPPLKVPCKNALGVDVEETTIDISNVKISINGAEPIKMNMVIPYNTDYDNPITEIKLTWNSTALTSGTMKLVIYYVPIGARKTSVKILEDNAGLAKESTLSAINGKLRTPVDDVFVKDVTVGTTATQLDTDTQVREEITMLADEGNTDTIYIGNSSNQLFPLKAGASLTLRKCSLSKIYAYSPTAGQVLHVICGGI